MSIHDLHFHATDFYVYVQYVTPSYLSFLVSQIEHRTRGVAWSQLLQTRLSALSQFVNKKILVLTLVHNEHGLTVYFTNNAFTHIIHWESY